MRSVQGRMWAVYSSASGTVLIACGAFWLSFVALADLARRSGIAREQAWIWPLLVDGLIVVATVAAVALDRRPGAWYPWTLLTGGALVSVAANALHALVTADTDMPLLLASAVASVPPLVLLASTHLTVVLIRSARPRPAVDAEPVLENAEHAAHAADPEPIAAVTPVEAPAIVPVEPVAALPDPHAPAPEPAPEPGSAPEPEPESVPEVDRRAEAARLREEHGWSNKRIARELGVHASTIGRWLPRPAPSDSPEPADAGAGAALMSSGASTSELIDAGSHPPIKEATP